MNKTGPRLSPGGLGAAERKLLGILCRGRLTGRDAANRLGVHPATVSRTASLLVEQGLVERQEGVDRRQTFLVPTEAGAALVAPPARRKAVVA